MNFKTLPPIFFKSSFLLVLITALAAFLRFYALGAESFWLDETASAIWSHKTIQEILRMQGEVHPPLYYLLMSFWVKIFGDTDFSLRAVSAILGVLSIPLIFTIARDLLKKTTPALIVALLLAVSQFHLHYSQEARSYALLMFLALASMYAFLHFFKNNSFKSAALYFFITTLLLYTHIFGAFFVIAQNLFYLLYKKESAVPFKKWTILQIVTFIAFAPWLGVLLRQTAAVQGNYWIERPGIFAIGELLLVFSGSLSVWGIIALMVFLALIALVLWRNRTVFKSDLAIRFALVWFAVPIITAFVLSLTVQPIFISRFLIGTFPAFLILAALGIDLLKNKSFKISAVAILTICSLINCAILLKETNKERWREAVHFTENLLQPGDTIIFHAGFTDGTYQRYAFKNGIEKLRFPREGNDILPKDLEELREIIRDKRRIALVLSHSRDTNGDIVKVLKEHFAEKQHRVYAHRSSGSHKELVGVEVYFFEK